MKTINFITSHFLPENTACTNRVLSIVKELEKTYKVNVICLTEKGVAPQDAKIEFTQNIDIFYIHQYAYNGKNFFNRAFNETIYILKLIKVANSLKCDVTIATSPYMFIIPIVGYSIKGYKVLDIRDLVWEYLSDKSFLNRIIKKILKLLMKQSMKKYHNIITTNEYELNFLSKQYGFSNTYIIPNGIEVNKYKKLINIVPKLNSKFTVTYVGNIGLAQNVKVFIDAALQLNDIKFLIIGDGIDKNALVEYVKNLKISNVIFTGKLEWDKLEEYYEQTSVLYAQLDEQYISAMPSKLYEYASTGLPIIYGGIGEAKTFISKLDNAISIQPNNTHELIRAIEQIRSQKLMISSKNKELIDSFYIREKTVNHMNDIINKIIGEYK